MWIWLALTFALLSSINILLIKLTLKKVDEYVIAWVGAVSSLPFSAAIILLFYQISKIDRFFVIGVLASALLNVAAGLLSYRSIKISEMSILAPISAFNPIFTMMISSVTLGEIPTARGFTGVFIIALGAYLLNASALKEGMLEPFKKLFSNRGIQLALVCNLIWAITPTFEKTAIFHTQPQVPPFVSLGGGCLLAIFFLPIMLSKSKKPFQQIRINLKVFLLMGIIGAIASAAAFQAFSLANLGYATAIFKLSMIFNVFWGYLFLKEKGIKERLLGSGVMFTGVLLLVL